MFRKLRILNKHLLISFVSSDSSFELTSMPHCWFNQKINFLTPRDKCAPNLEKFR